MSEATANPAIELLVASKIEAETPFTANVENDGGGFYLYISPKDGHRVENAVGTPVYEDYCALALLLEEDGGHWIFWNGAIAIRDAGPDFSITENDEIDSGLTGEASVEEVLEFFKKSLVIEEKALKSSKHLNWKS